MLRRVGAHLQPKHPLRVAHLDVAQHDVAVVHALAAQREAPVNSAVIAVLDEHIIHGSVLWSLVSPSSLAALYGDSVVVHAHIASVHQHVVTHVNVDGVAARGFHAACGGEDSTVEKPHVVAAVDVVGPKRTVLDMHVLHRHVA